MKKAPIHNNDGNTSQKINQAQGDKLEIHEGGAELRNLVFRKPAQTTGAKPGSPMNKADRDKVDIKASGFMESMAFVINESISRRIKKQVKNI